MNEQPLRILLVEDNHADARLLRATLAAARSVLFEVTQAQRLSEALPLLALERFDVVLLDLFLSDSHGLDTFATLHTQAPNVPIVVLIGLDNETIAVEAVQGGAQDYLVKGQAEGHVLVRAMRYAIERQRAEEALRYLRDWLDVTLSSIGDAVIATDTRGLVTFINSTAVELTGWASAEALGRHIDEVCCIVHEQTRQAIDSPVVRVLREATVVMLEDGAMLLARDGRECCIADRAAPIRNSQGTLHGVVLVFRDISERKRLEEQLRQSQKMEAIGTLAGGIAHDFNNILAAVLGYTEMATYDVPPDNPAQGYLQQVLTAGNRAKDLVQQILAFSRRSQEARRPVQLHLLVQEALTLLRASFPSTIEIQQHLSQDAGVVLADATQMHQVLMNLCANAEYAMRETGGVLAVRLEAVVLDTSWTVAHPGLIPGPYVRLTVRDTGPGIAPDVLKRIFEPFFTTKGPTDGTGMGLAVVYGIITSHSGTITVSSVPGQGATFAVYLPQLQATTTAGTRAEEPLPTGKERLLLVDDETAVAHVGQTLLERLGYEVIVCLSSGEALEAFRAAPHRFDLIITDQTMPRMTGDALASALRRIRPDIPIILCTGFSHTIDAAGAAALGIDAWVTKPWEMRALAHTIRQVLAQRRA